MQNHFWCKIIQKAFYPYRNSVVILSVISSCNTRAKITPSSNVLHSSYSLKCFFCLFVCFLMLPYTTILIRGLRLWYNSSNIGNIFCNKRFKGFLDGQISKDKPTPLQMLNFLYYFDATTSYCFYIYSSFSLKYLLCNCKSIV